MAVVTFNSLVAGGLWWLEAGWLAVALVKRERRGVTEEAKH